MFTSIVENRIAHTMLIHRHLWKTAAFALVLSAGIAPSTAQDAYPARQITMIVPFAAGGTSDVIARIVSEELGKQLGQRIVIENVAGAGGSTGLTRLARATADGYTIGIGNSGTSAAVYWIHDNVTFKPDDFAPIGLVAKTAPVIALKSDFPATDMAGFLDYLKKNPGKVTLGHAGTGSSNYLICLNFIQAAKAEVQLVGYRGAAPALNDLLTKTIDGVCDTATSLQSHVQAGNARAMAVATDTRLKTLPNVPTSAEAGLPEFSMQGWNAFFAPKGTPAPVVAKLNEALQKALNGDVVQKRLEELSASTPPLNERTPLGKGRGDQRLRIGLSRRSENLLHAALLDDSTILHDDHMIGQGAHHGQIVADEQIGQPVCKLEVSQQLDHGFLDRAVQR
jgi:tripartite-type tricarboxylate transporter receptor subunit TctC